jgi:Ca-activated chloride channel homolog
MTIRIAPADIADPTAPASAPEPDAGLGTLATSQGNLPLEALDIRAVIAGTTGSVELAQGFRNPFDVPLEATYIFPLPDRAAVTAMRMEAAGHVVEAVLKERGQARTDYDTAVAQGRRAAIAEEDRPDVFTMRVGNILAGEQVTVRLRLVQPLPVEDGEITFRFPLVVAPRYIPGRPLDGAPAGSGVAADTGAVPDASRISPPVLLPGFPNPVRLSLRAEIDPAGLALAGIRCSLHAAAQEDGPSGRTVVALRPGERLDRDFILRLALTDGHETAASLVLTPDAEQDPGEGTFLLTLLPPAGQGRARPRDVALVLDRSGSMSGWKIVAARRAAARIVDTLTTADRFAVFCFDNVVERPPDLPDGLAEGTDRNRFRAVEHLSRTAARGGTEMLDPLDRAAGLLAGATEPETPTAGTAGPAAAPGRDRVLVLITDGQVGNEDQILRHLGPKLAGIRVHAVGIDQAVNAGFLSRLATVGGGRCELVESEDRLDAAAERIHRRIGAPLAAGLTLSTDGLQIVPGTVAPSRLPDLFPGVPLTVAGRWRGQPGGTVTVRGATADGQPFEVKAVAVTADIPASRALWARAHLRDLEDRYASLEPSGPAGLDRLEQQITGESLRHGVLCRFTAFVATDSRVVTDGGTPHRVTQPVEFPSGWEPAAFGLPSAPGHPMTSAGYSARRPMPLLQAAAGGEKLPAPTAGRARTGRPGVPAAGVARSVRPQRRPAVMAGDAHRLALARRQAAQEAAVLRAARRDPETERRRLLADLASRLDALVASLAGEPSLGQQRARLAELAGKLRDCDQPPPRYCTELDALWDEAIALLMAFGEGRLPAGEEPAARPFWKRQT